ncbi:hypothetical protein [Motilimonas sp. E26]|uniref:VapA family S-layer protein n=1 Tax=Motilimonas sp. E26 TaxID=2865674 RepID=UPI001E3F0D9E|nr:hypothetical protein [Motilimonas sp. E26]MCE0558543.1 hypothetical protein [Motilimonas sp. E26]
MFQKKLIAAAILAGFSAAPAMADVSVESMTPATSTLLATVTKAPVLALTTAQQLLVVGIPANELLLDGALTVEIKGEATFNDGDVRKFLTLNGGSYAVGLGAVGALSYAQADVEAQFDTDTDGTATWLKYTIDQDGKRLRLYSKQDNTAVSFGFKFAEANQIFNVAYGFSSDIKLMVGALKNASYTSDPVTTSAIFSPVKLFKLTKASTPEDIAQVAEGFLKLKNDADNKITYDALKVENLTTNQLIQKNKVKVTIEGDFTGAKVSATGELQDNTGAGLGWQLANGKATKVLDTSGTLEGQAGIPTADVTGFMLAFNGTDAIEASKYKATATILGSDNATFEDFTAELADIFIVNRDGMRFDTITTGTTSSNLIYIRDISKKLPAVGGKIFVTVTEYAPHDVNGKGEGTDLVVRKALSTMLPSGGAVTLDPKLIQEDLGVTVTAGRQARFLFEVETNQGEVAIKKQVSGVGVDIQNGTKGVAGVVVDFTL